jgi:acyl transferase domain-containing protein
VTPSQAARERQEEPGVAPVSEVLLWPLSAKTAAALPAVAQRLADHVERSPEISLRDLAFTYQIGKAGAPHRLALASSSRSELIAQCRAVRAPAFESGTRAAGRVGEPMRTAFLFTGQGSQYAGMGAELYAASPVFRDSIDRCAAVLDRLLPHRLVDVLFDRSAPARIHETELTQPALFSLEYALAQQWMSWGVVPGMLLGHSLGEWVAACIGGAVSVEDACALVFHRGALMQRLCRRGAMLSVAAHEDAVTPVLARHGLQAVIAVRNSTENLVVAGDAETLEIVQAELTRRSIKSKSLSVSHAFHSPMMEPMIASFASHLDRARISPLTIPMISNLDGTVRQGGLDTGYWTSQIRSSVQLTACLATLEQWQPHVILEIGPQPVLGKLAQQRGMGGAAILQSLRRDHPELQTMSENLGRSWCAGLEVSWSALYQGAPPRRTHAPAYPYQREAYLNEAAASAEKSSLGAAPDGALPKPAPRPAVAKIDPDADLETVQHVLAGIWCEVLGVKTVAADADFSQLGADSLDAVGLVKRTKQVTGLSLTLEEQYLHRTLGAIAQLLHGRLATEGGRVVVEPEAAPAAELPEQRAEVAVVSGAARPVAAVFRELRHVAILGGPTALGARLVKELTETRGVAVDCLIEGVAPELGRDAGWWATVDTVFDLRALDDGRAPGVADVAGLLQLAADHPDIWFHRATALRRAPVAPGEEIVEPASASALCVGADEAERLLGAAQQRGARITLHRVGELVGDATTGRASADLMESAFYREALAVSRADVILDSEGAIDVTPVDFAASALVELASQEDCAGRTFHVCNPRPLDRSDLHDALRALGYSITAVSQPVYRDWCEQEGREPAALPAVLPHFDCAATQQISERLGVHCPAPDRDLLFRLLLRCIDTQLFDPPPRWGLLRRVFFEGGQYV